MRAARSFLVLGALGFLGACSGSDGGDLTFDSAATGASTLPVVDTADPTPSTTPPTTAPPTSGRTVAPTTSTAVPTTAPAAPTPAAARTYAVAPTGVPFPNAEWPTAALPTGVDQAAIDTAVDVAFGPPDAAGRVQSIVVVKDGSIVYERYHPLDGPDKVYESWSVAKSVTSALIGLLVQDGLLELDGHPTRAEWSAPADPRQAITVRHLLQMTSGLAWIDDGFQPGTYGARLLSAPNAAHLVASEPLWAEPGTVFNYSTGTTALLVGIAADVLGGCQAVTDYLDARLLDPIGITTDQLVTDGDGCWIGGLGANMTTRDFARFGLLYLRGGVWDGTPLLPSTWVDESLAPVAINPQYGLHWWLSPDGTRFMAEGLYGQRIVLVPGQDLMVVTNSTDGGDAVTVVDAVISAFSDTP